MDALAQQEEDDKQHEADNGRIEKPEAVGKEVRLIRGDVGDVHDAKQGLVGRKGEGLHGAGPEHHAFADVLEPGWELHQHRHWGCRRGGGVAPTCGLRTSDFGLALCSLEAFLEDVRRHLHFGEVELSNHAADRHPLRPHAQQDRIELLDAGSAIHRQLRVEDARESGHDGVAADEDGALHEVISFVAAAREAAFWTGGSASGRSTQLPPSPQGEPRHASRRQKGEQQARQHGLRQTRKFSLEQVLLPRRSCVARSRQFVLHGFWHV